jgi:hypothetical protein
MQFEGKSERMSSDIQPPNSSEGPVYIYNADRQKFSWRQNLSELKQYRYLLRNLVVRDLKARYKNSVLGILWSILNPMFLMLVFTVLFSVLANNQIRQYPIFVLVGLIPWNFFSGSLTSGTTAVTGNSALVKKVYFPRELLPTSALLSNLVNFFFAFAVLIVFLLHLQDRPDGSRAMGSGDINYSAYIYAGSGLVTGQPDRFLPGRPDDP